MGDLAPIPAGQRRVRFPRPATFVWQAGPPEVTAPAPTFLEAEARTVAAIYPIPLARRQASTNPHRQLQAMVRLAHYVCRRLARAEGYVVDHDAEVKVLESWEWDEPRLVAIRLSARAWPVWVADFANVSLDTPRQ